jgi:Helicase conserved C-terminal domain
MPDLTESLQGRDLGHLRIVTKLWGSELKNQDISSAILHLNTLLLKPALVKEMVASLPVEVKTALDDLIQHAGRLPWAQFSRAYGEVREMGPAKRDRERPFDQPVSPAESLWYRALVARAFFDSPAGPEEFAYIPDDLLKLIPRGTGTEQPTYGRQASTLEYASVSKVNDRILDHACTLLAALRLGIGIPDEYVSTGGELFTSTFMISVLIAEGLLDNDSQPIPEPMRIFLEARRGEALRQIFIAWKQSSTTNELSLLPDRVIEGNWVNDPLRTRRTILDYIITVPTGTWWSLNSFISAIKQHNPDFQRPAGDYDSWFIRSCISSEYLRGFKHWDEVDGRLIKYIITGPLHWLGVLDLAYPEGGQEVTAFRLSGWSKALLNDKAPEGLPVEEEPLVVRSDARLSARRLVPRRVRYQVARFCDWVKETPDEYQYRISPGSLARARQQGLSVSQLVALLTRHAKVVPPSLIKALERWENQGSEARLEQMVVLRVVSEDILLALRKSRASRFLGESLGPTSVAVKAGAFDKVLGALAELGYLGEIRGDVD